VGIASDRKLGEVP